MNYSVHSVQRVYTSYQCTLYTYICVICILMYEFNKLNYTGT